MKGRHGNALTAYIQGRELTSAQVMLNSDGVPIAGYVNPEKGSRKMRRAAASVRRKQAKRKGGDI
jgi:hypothetical protein